MTKGLRGALVLVLISSPFAQAQIGTAFTYQGRLSDSTAAANGSFDMEFRLFDAPSGPAQVGSTVTKSAVAVSAGLFTVTVDFGGSAFSGQMRWLEIAVKPTLGSTYTTLTPRQELTPVPNAVFAGKAGDAATVSGLSCTDGQVLKWSGLAWGCGSDSNSGGTVTSVTGGAGLSGGTITGTGTLGIATGGVTSSMIANGAVGLAQIDTSQVQTRLAAVCPDGQFLRGVNPDGTVLCGILYLPPTISTIDVLPGQVQDTFTSLAIGTDGSPVIAYWGQSSGLKVAKCANAACTGISAITIVDAGDVGRYASLAIGTDGFPVIGYHDNAAGALKVAKCVNAACTGTSTLTTIDGPTVGTFASLAVGVDGFPVLAYLDGSVDALKVAKCVNAACTGTSTITTVENPTNPVSYFSITIGTDAFPVISYQDLAEGTLKVAKCVDAACQGAAIATVDDPANNVGTYSSIKIGADGFPVISYHDNSGGALKVAKCMNAACTGASIVTTIDDPPTPVGGFTSLALGADGVPVISYWDHAGALKVAKCVNAACTATSIITTVDDPPVNSVGRLTSLAIGTDGFPVISYFDSTALAIKFAKCNKASCSPFIQW